MPLILAIFSIVCIFNIHVKECLSIYKKYIFEKSPNYKIFSDFAGFNYGGADCYSFALMQNEATLYIIFTMARKTFCFSAIISQMECRRGQLAIFHFDFLFFIQLR